MPQGHDKYLYNYNQWVLIRNRNSSIAPAEMKHDVCWLSMRSDFLSKWNTLYHFLMIFLVSLVSHAIVPEIRIITFHTDYLDSGAGSLSLSSLSLSLSSCLLGQHALKHRGCIFFYFLNKTDLYENYNMDCPRAVTCQGL